jgi:hypothetical protein
MAKTVFSFFSSTNSTKIGVVWLKIVKAPKIGNKIKNVGVRQKQMRQLLFSPRLCSWSLAQ